MCRNTKSISEVIDLACKGLMPIKNEFLFQDEIYKAKGIDVKRREFWNFLYRNEDENKRIHFHFENEELKYVELSPSDSEDSFLLYESTWTPAQIKKAYYNFGM